MILRARAPARLVRALRFRPFSSSAPRRRRGPLNVFPSTSNQELDAIVAQFRDNIFVPKHLNTAYRQMIYRPSQHIYLTGEEPVKVSLPIRPAYSGQEMPSSLEREKSPQTSKTDSKDRDKPKSKLPRAKAPHIHGPKTAKPQRETFTLAPLHMNVDIPGTRRNYTRMLQLMQTSQDFQIVPAFLRELRIADLPVTPAMLAKTARRSAELDRVDVAIQLFQSVDKLGFQINHPEIVKHMMLATVRYAANGYWTERRVAKAQSFADSVLVMMRDPRHQTSNEREQAVSDAHTLAQSFGTAMALSAIHTLRYGALGPSPSISHSLSTLVSSFLEHFDLRMLRMSGTSWAKQNEELASWGSSLVGVNYAIQALGKTDPLAMKLQLVVPAVDEMLGKLVEAVRQGSEHKDCLGLLLLDSMAEALTVEPPAGTKAEEPVLLESDEFISKEELFEEEETEELKQTGQHKE